MTVSDLSVYCRCVYDSLDLKNKIYKKIEMPGAAVLQVEKSEKDSYMYHVRDRQKYGSFSPLRYVAYWQVYKKRHS